MAAVDVPPLTAFVVLGAVIGFLAGLLGIGGGMSMVPSLTIIFGSRGFPQTHVVHMAVARRLSRSKSIPSACATIAPSPVRPGPVRP